MLLAILQTDFRCSSSRHSFLGGQCTNLEAESLDEINLGHGDHIGYPEIDFKTPQEWLVRTPSGTQASCLFAEIEMHSWNINLRTLQYGQCKFPSPI